MIMSIQMVCRGYRCSHLSPLDFVAFQVAQNPKPQAPKPYTLSLSLRAGSAADATETSTAVQPPIAGSQDAHAI